MVDQLLEGLLAWRFIDWSIVVDCRSLCGRGVEGLEFIALRIILPCLPVLEIILISSLAGGRGDLILGRTASCGPDLGLILPELRNEALIGMDLHRQIGTIFLFILTRL